MASEDPRIQPAALGVDDAARYLGISSAGVRRRVTDGTIPAVRIGNRVLIRVVDLDVILAGGAS